MILSRTNTELRLFLTTIISDQRVPNSKRAEISMDNINDDVSLYRKNVQGFGIKNVILKSL